MNKPKYKITLFNENQYTKKELIGIPIKYTTATNLYNSITHPPFNIHPHQFKSNDSFTVNDSRIRLIIFYGSEVESVVYKDGNVRQDIIGSLELIKEA